MTANTKAILCFAVGLVGGAAASYFFLDAKYEKLLDEKVEEETKAVREKYTRMLEKYDLAVNKKVAEDAKDEVKDIRDNSAGHDGHTPVVEYNKYASESYIPVKGASVESVNSMRDEIDKVSKDAHEESFEEHMAGLEHPEEDEDDETEEERLEREGLEETIAANEAFENYTGPYIISPDDFSETNLNYEKRDWDYYSENQVMVDEEDQVVEDYEDYVGTQFKNWYEKITPESEYLPECYVRNDRFGTDYCINPFPEKWIFDEEIDDLEPHEDVDRTPFEPEIHISSR